jgi:hypothetical protein
MCTAYTRADQRYLSRSTSHTEWLTVLFGIEVHIRGIVSELTWLRSASLRIVVRLPTETAESSHLRIVQSDSEANHVFLFIGKL